MTGMIRVLVADDHPVLREGLRALFATTPDMQLVGDASNGAEAVELARAVKPDVILLDLVMPHEDGIEVITAVKRENPDARILVLTSFAEDDKVFAVIRQGVSGFQLKDVLPGDLLQAIRTVAAGQSSLHPLIARKVLQQLSAGPRPAPARPALTDRELEVLNLVAQALDTEEIAERLSVSPRTVRTHISNLLGKLNLANRTQLALYALNEGLVSRGTND